MGLEALLSLRHVIAKVRVIVIDAKINKLLLHLRDDFPELLIVLLLHGLVVIVDFYKRISQNYSYSNFTYVAVREPFLLHFPDFEAEQRQHSQAELATAILAV